MANLILGGGAVALLARHILGPKWQIVPFAESRFFRFRTALDDNFITHDVELDPFIKDLQTKYYPTNLAPVKVFPYRRAVSIGGTLVKTYHPDLIDDVLVQLFGVGNVPSHARLYLSTRMEFAVYDVRVNELYGLMMKEWRQALLEEAQKGQITEVGDHYIVRGGVKEEFDYAVSTIPLNALMQLMRRAEVFRAKPMHYYHVATPSLDFEGCNQVLVADQASSFWKSTNIGPQRYTFYFHTAVPNPGPYFMTLMPQFEIIDGTSIKDAIPLGNMPTLDWFTQLESKGIFCVGSYAQWDWCADIGSCIKRLLRYSTREFKLRNKWKAI